MNTKYILFAALVFVVCIFGGCSSGVSVGLSVLPDGTIRQSYTVVLDANELSKKYSTEKVQKIYSTVYEYLDNWKTSVNLKAEAYRGTYMADSGHYPWIANISPSADNGMTPSGQITAYVLFYSSYFYDEYYKFVYGDTGEDDDDADEEYTTKKGWLFDTIIFQDMTVPIADQTGIQEYYNELKTDLASQGIELNEDIKLANIAYDYAVPYSYAQVNRIKSNADREYTQNEKQLSSGGVATEYTMKHYVWNYDANGENRLVLYRYRVHAVAWYVLALVLVVVFGAIMILCNFISKKRKARKVGANAVSIQTIYPHTESDIVDNQNINNDTTNINIDNTTKNIEKINNNNENNKQ